MLALARQPSELTSADVFTLGIGKGSPGAGINGPQNALDHHPPFGARLNSRYLFLSDESRKNSATSYSKVRADTAPVGCLDGLSQECLLGLRESENEFDQSRRGILVILQSSSSTNPLKGRCRGARDQKKLGFFLQK